MSELKPCPFCGERPGEPDTAGVVYHIRNNCQLSDGDFDVSWWNTRTASTSLKKDDAMRNDVSLPEQPDGFEAWRDRWFRRSEIATGMWEFGDWVDEKGIREMYQSAQQQICDKCGGTGEKHTPTLEDPALVVACDCQAEPPDKKQNIKNTNQCICPDCVQQDLEQEEVK